MQIKQVQMYLLKIMYLSNILTHQKELLKGDCSNVQSSFPQMYTKFLQYQILRFSSHNIFSIELTCGLVTPVAHQGGGWGLKNFGF